MPNGNQLQAPPNLRSDMSMAEDDPDFGLVNDIRQVFTSEGPGRGSREPLPTAQAQTDMQRDWEALPLSEKSKVLMQNPDYKALPANEKMKVLNQVQYGGKTQFEQAQKFNPWTLMRGQGATSSELATHAMEEGIEGAKQLYGAGKEIVMPQGNTEGERLKDIMNKLVLQPADEQRNEAGQAWKQGRYSEAAGHGIASVLPVMGPAAANFAEQGANDPVGAVAQNIPAAAVGEITVAPDELKEPLAMAVRRSSNELRTPIRTVAKFGGGAAGYSLGEMAGEGFHHPWIGMAAGYEVGPKLIDAILPERRFTSDEARSARSARNATPDSSAPVPVPKDEGNGVEVLPTGRDFNTRITPEQIPGSDLDTMAQRGDWRAGQEKMRRGKTVLYADPDAEYSGRRLKDDVMRWDSSGQIIPPD